MFSTRRRGMHFSKAGLISVLVALIMVLQIATPVSAFSMDGSYRFSQASQTAALSQAAKSYPLFSDAAGSKEDSGSSGSTTDGTQQGTTPGTPGAQTITVPVAEFGQSPQPDADGIIVRFKDGTSKAAAAGAMSAASVKAASVNAAGSGEASGQLQLVDVPAGTDLNSALASIRNDPNVAYAEPNYKLHALDTPAPPNDPQFGQQWAMEEIEAVDGWAEANKDLKGAAASSKIIAVIDTGVDANHHDLGKAGPGLNGRVLDGYNAITGTNNASDDSVSGHGTMVAGIAAAITNNNTGIAGTAGEFPIKILPVKVLDSSGTGTLYDVAQGIIWAADHGANIINLSLGERLPDYPQSLADAVTYARNRSILVVAAAGNENKEVSGFYPACLPGVLAITASGKDHKKAPFSNYSNPTSYTIIFAPGVDILSTLPGGNEAQYGTMSGTSAAAPIASGIAAVLWSAFNGKSLADLSNAITYGQRMFNDYNGANPDYSYCLSLLMALSRFETGYPPFDSIKITNPAAGGKVDGTVTVSVQAVNPHSMDHIVFSLKPGDSATYTELGTITANPITIPESGLFTYAWDTTKVANGKYTLKVDYYKTGSIYPSSDSIDTTVENTMKSGLNIRILKPDNSNPGHEVAAAGAYVSVHHIIHINEQGQDRVYYEPVWTGNADQNGVSLIPGSIATDGNDYIVSARGSDPGFLYYSELRAPSETVMSSADAVKITFSGSDPDTGSQTLPGAVILSDWLGGGQLANTIASDLEELRTVPAAKLNGQGQGEVYLTKGSYNFRLLDSSKDYYFLQQNVGIAGTSQEIGFHPGKADLAVIKPVSGEAAGYFSRTGLLLKENTGAVMLGFQSVDAGKGVLATPGIYQAEILADKNDPNDSSKYWEWALKPPASLTTVAGNTCQIPYGGAANASGDRILAAISPYSAQSGSGGYAAQGTATFKADFKDAANNETVGMYTIPYSNPNVSGSSTQSRENKILKSTPVSGSDANIADQSVNHGGIPLRVFAYDPSTSGFEVLSSTVKTVYPQLVVKKGDGSAAPNGQSNMAFLPLENTWVGTWQVPDSLQTNAFSAQAAIGSGPIQSHDSAPLAFTAFPFSPSQCDLAISVKGTDGNPLSGARVAVLKRVQRTGQAGGYIYDFLRDSNSLPVSVQTDSQGTAGFRSGDLVNGRKYMALVYINADPGMNKDGLFIPQEFTYDATVKSLVIDAHDASKYNLQRVAIMAKDQNGASLGGNLDYFLFAGDSGGVPAGMWLQNLNSLNGLTLLLPKAGSYTFVTALVKQDQGSLYSMSKKVDTLPNGQTAYVQLGGTGLRAVAFKLPQKTADNNSTYKIGGVAFFSSGIPQAPELFPGNDQTVYVYGDSGTYTAEMLLARSHYDGEWDYSLARDITPESGKTYEWQVADSYSASLGIVARTYAGQDTVQSVHTIMDADQNRLLAIRVKPGATGAGVTQSGAAGGIVDQNHQEIAPFLVIRDPAGNEAYRHKDASSNYAETALWSQAANTSPNIVTRADLSGTFFGDSFVVQPDMPGFIYKASLELGIGPEGDIRSSQVNLDIGTAPGSVLEPLASPIRQKTITLNGFSYPGAAVNVLYSLDGKPDVAAWNTTAGADGSFQFKDVGLPKDGSYDFHASALLNGKTGKDSNHVLLVVDTTPPNPPQSLSAAGQDETHILVSWNAPTDQDVAKYEIYRKIYGTDDSSRVFVAEVPAGGNLEFLDGQVHKDENYVYEVTAVDQAGNISNPATVNASTSGRDMTPPSAPAGLKADAVPGGSVNLAWDASMDNVGVAGYRIWRDAHDQKGPQKIAEVDGLTFKDTGLSAKTTYTYAVAAFDAAGNQSGQSTIDVTTPEVRIYSIQWKLPRRNISGAAYTGDDLSILVNAEPGRSGRVDIQYQTWYSANGTLLSKQDGPRTVDTTATLAETAGKPGTYGASFRLDPGVSSVKSIKAVMSDQAGSTSELSAVNFYLNTTGSLKVKFNLPPGISVTTDQIDSYLQDATLTVYSKSARCGKTVTAPTSGDTGNIFDGLTAADDYTVALVGPNGGSLGELDGVSIVGGLMREAGLTADMPASVDIRVIDDSGKPVVNAAVRLDAPGNYIFNYGITDQDGYVVIPNTREHPIISFMKALDKVTASIRFYDDDSAMAYDETSKYDLTYTPAPGMNAWMITLKRRAFTNLRGTVTANDGKALSGTDVRVTQTMNGHVITFTTTTASDGGYLLQVAALPADVVFNHWNTPPVTDHMDIQAQGATRDVQLNLQNVISMIVYSRMCGDDVEHLLQIDWRVASQFIIQAKNLTSNTVFMRKYGVSSFEFNVEGNPGDRISVTLDGSQAGLSTAEQTVTLDKNAFATVELHLAEMGKLVGKLKDDANSDRPGVARTVILFKQTGGVSQGTSVVRTTSDFSFSGLAAGKYSLYAHWGDESSSWGYSSFVSGSMVQTASAMGSSMNTKHVTDIEVKNTEVTDLGSLALPLDQSVTDGYFYGKDGNSFTADVSEAAPGSVVTFRAAYSYTKSLVKDDPKDMKLYLAIPAGTTLVPGSLSCRPANGTAVPEQPLGTDQIVVDLDFGSGQPAAVAGVATYQVKIGDHPEDTAIGAEARIDFKTGIHPNHEGLGGVAVDIPYVTLSVPKELSPDNTKGTVHCTGRAPAGETVSVYDGSFLLGKATATSYGTWSLDVILADRGKPSYHTLNATVPASDGTEITSSYSDVIYGLDSTVIKRVTLFQDNGSHQVTFIPSQGVGNFPFTFNPNMTTTMDIEFTHNERVTNVVIQIGNDPNFVTWNAAYNSQKGCFEATGRLYAQQAGAIYITYDLLPDPYVQPNVLIPNAEQQQEIRQSLPDPWQNATVSFDSPVNQGDDFWNEADGAYEPPAAIITLDDPGKTQYVDTVKVTPLQGFDPGTAAESYPLSGGYSSYNPDFTILPDGGVEASYIAPMEALAGHHGGGSYTGYALVTSVMYGFVEGAEHGVAHGIEHGMHIFEIYNVVKSGFEYKEKLDKLQEALKGSVGCNQIQSQYYEDRAQSLADGAAVNTFMECGIALVGVALACTGVGLIGLAAIAVIGGVAAYTADKQWEHRYDEMKEEMANDPGCWHPQPDRDRDKVADPKYLYDPSGYAYEAVPSNRLPGVTATALQEDDAAGTWSVWDAEEFNQENPLVTDAQGVYAWDVPFGHWQVVYAKPGYETAHSDVVQVPPPQTEVNVGMVSTSAPAVSEIRPAAGGGIDILFNQYMRTGSFTNFAVTITNKGGDNDVVPGTIAPVNPVTDPGNVSLAKVIRFTPNTPLTNGSIYTVLVNQSVQNYAGHMPGQDISRDVTYHAYIPVTGVSLNKHTLTLTTGQSDALHATVSPDNATNKDVTWSSSKPNIASVESDGTVTALSSGTADITVTAADGGMTYFCAVTVNIPVTGITLDPQTLTLTAGDAPVKLMANVTPDNATDKNVTWSSSNENVACVCIKGYVTPNAPGTATITATTQDGGFTATCKVTVKAKPAPSDGNNGYVTVPSPVSSPVPSNEFIQRLGSGAQTVSAYNGAIVLQIPDGAFPDGTTLTIKKTTDQAKPGSVSMVVGGDVYEIDAGGVQPQKPIVITVKYDLSRLGDTDLTKLGLYRQDDKDPAVWNYVNGSVDTSAGTVTGILDHFSSYAVMAYDRSFTDIKGHKFQKEIELLASRHIVDGTGGDLFMPDSSITRAEIAKILVNMLISDPNNGIKLIKPEKPAFSDETKDAWYYTYVETAASYGIVKGSSGKFRPNDRITRQELAIMVMRILSSEEGIKAAANGKLNCTDAEKVAAWATAYMNAALQRKLMDLDSAGNIRPLGYATRGESSAVIAKAMDQLGLVHTPVAVKGMVTINEIEGRHYEISVSGKDGSKIYVLMPADSNVGQLLANSVNKEAEVTGLILSGAGIYMRGTSMTVLWIGEKPKLR